MMKKILLIGIQGSLARLVAKKLLQSNPSLQLLGVDSRPITMLEPLEGLSIERLRYTRSSFERLFRQHDFDAILHLGRLSHAGVMSDRIHTNLMGTSTILELAQKSQVKRVVILSTHHVYGALPDNPLFLTEEAPLRASFKYPELRDVVEMDQMATNWMWRYQNQINTVVLRPCNIIGPTIKNAFTQYLTTRYTPAPIDYNPLLQFIHEEDMASVVELALHSLPTGLYNVAPPDYIQLRAALLYLRLPRLPFLLSFLHLASRMAAPVWRYPRYLLDYIKYQATINGDKFQSSAPAFKFRYGVYEALDSLSAKNDID